MAADKVPTCALEVAVADAATGAVAAARVAGLIPVAVLLTVAASVVAERVALLMDASELPMNMAALASGSVPSEVPMVKVPAALVMRSA